MSEKCAELHQNSNFRFFQKTQVSEKNMFLRKNSIKNKILGNFGKELRNQNFKRGFLRYRAIGNFYVIENQTA